MALRDYAIGSGIARGAERGAQNFLSAYGAVQERDRKKKAFDLDYKVKELQLKKLEGELSPEIIDLQRQMLQNQKKQGEIKLKAEELAFDKAFEEKKRQDELRQSLDTDGDGIPNAGALPPGSVYKTGNLTLKGQPYPEANAYKQETLDIRRQQAQREEQKAQTKIADAMARIKNYITIGGYYGKDGKLNKFASKSDMQSFLIEEEGSIVNSPEVQNMMNNIEEVTNIWGNPKAVKYTAPDDIIVPEAQSTTRPVDKAVLAEQPQGQAQLQQVDVNKRVQELYLKGLTAEQIRDKLVEEGYKVK